MENIEELRAELNTIFSGIKGGSLELKKASEMNNTIGKILNSLKVELAYAAITGKKPNIPFLTKGKTITLPSAKRPRALPGAKRNRA